MNLVAPSFAGPPDAPTLLLLHGVGRNHRDWLGLIPEWTRTWNVVALDHSGHGDSPRTPGAYRVVDHAQRTAAFLQQRQTKPVVVIGHSLGAMIALFLAATNRDDVAGVVLEDPPFHTMGSGIAPTLYQAQFRGMKDVAQRGGTEEDMVEGLASIRLNTTLRLGDIRDRAALRFSAECLAKVDPEVFDPLIAGRWLDGFDDASLWSRVRCPMLLLQGDPSAGGAFTDDDVALARAVLPDVQHRTFPGVGHQIHQTRPEAFLTAVAAWSQEKNLHR